MSAAGRSDVRDDLLLDLNSPGVERADPYSMQTTTVTGFRADPWKGTDDPAPLIGASAKV